MTGVELFTIGSMAVTLADAVAVAGTALTAVSAVKQGQAAEAQAESQRLSLEHQAAQARQLAGQERAASQRDALEERRKSKLIQSRALAVAAASGAGASDPTVVDILSDLEGEGELRAMTALYEGESRAQSLETGADLRGFEGAQLSRAGRTARQSGYMKAGGALLTGGAAVAEQIGSRRKKDTTLDEFADDGLYARYR